MNHYENMRNELEQLASNRGDRNGQLSPHDVAAFNLPASIVLVAIKYALKSAWSDEDRQEIKVSILELYDDVVVPLDAPVVDGAAEVAIEKIGRGILSAALDLIFG